MKWLLVFALFGTAEPPPHWVNDLPTFVKKEIVGLAQYGGLLLPDEEVDLNCMDGVMYYIRRRFINQPLEFDNWGRKRP